MAKNLFQWCVWEFTIILRFLLFFVFSLFFFGSVAKAVGVACFNSTFLNCDVLRQT